MGGVPRVGGEAPGTPARDSGRAGVRRDRRVAGPRDPEGRRGAVTGPGAGWGRTHTCGALRSADAGRTATLVGWAYRRRDHGGLIFVDLRDREGITQLVFNPGTDAAAHAVAGRIRAEFVVAVRGLVQRRPEGTVNPGLPTGEVEVLVQAL